MSLEKGLFANLDQEKKISLCEVILDAGIQDHEMVAFSSIFSFTNLFVSMANARYCLQSSSQKYHLHCTFWIYFGLHPLMQDRELVSAQKQSMHAFFVVYPC